MEGPKLSEKGLVDLVYTHLTPGVQDYIINNTQSISPIGEFIFTSEETRNKLYDLLDNLAYISHNYDQLRSAHFVHEGILPDESLAELDNLAMRIMKFKLFEDNVIVQSNAEAINSIFKPYATNAETIQFAKDMFNKIEMMFNIYKYLVGKNFAEPSIIPEKVKASLNNFRETLADYLACNGR